MPLSEIAIPAKPGLEPIMWPIHDQPSMPMACAPKLRLCAALAVLALTACTALEEFTDTIRVDIVVDSATSHNVRIPLHATKSFGVVLLATGSPDGSAPPQVTVTSNDPGIAEVTKPALTGIERSALIYSHGVTFDVTGRAPGNAVITASGSGNEILGIPDVKIFVEVFAPNLRAAIAPATLDLQRGDRSSLTCTVTDADSGVQHPSAPVEWSSSQPAVVVVAQDGTVTAQADGSADITCKVAGTSASATARVNVGPPSSTPAAGAIPGTYHLTGPKVSDNCAAGTFPTSLNVDVLVRVTQNFGVTTITLSSATEVSGVYQDPAGAWRGTGVGSTVLGVVSAVLTQRIIGRWESGPPVKLRGTVLYMFFTADQPAVELCGALFDATFTKLN